MQQQWFRLKKENFCSDAHGEGFTVEVKLESGVAKDQSKKSLKDQN